MPKYPYLFKNLNKSDNPTNPCLFNQFTIKKLYMSHLLNYDAGDFVFLLIIVFSPILSNNINISNQSYYQIHINMCQAFFDSILNNGKNSLFV